MAGDEHLRRLKEYKRPRPVGKPIGQLVQRYGLRHSGQKAAQLHTIWQAVSQVVDETFMQHCSLGSFEKGVLRIHVDDPGLAYSFRRDNLFRLKEHLEIAVPKVRIQDIRFEAGQP